MGALQDPLFRLTEGDRVPALAISMQGINAVLPLPAVAKLFSMAPDCADARMLHLIGQSLKFVSCLRIGDPLPAEVCTGEASWEPTPYHCQLAAARLQLQLVNWIGGATDASRVTSQMLAAMIDDPAIRPRLQLALRQAADELSISGGGPAVAARVEELAAELAYIEALRDRLLHRVQAMLRRLVRFGQDGTPMAGARRETLNQVTSLATIGLSRITSRFDQVDAQTGEIIAALRNLEQQRTFVRPHRDWLYAAQIAWEPVLKEWESLPPSLATERLWKVMEILYRFLAPRFMPVQEWQSMLAQTNPEKNKAAFVW